MAGFSRAIMLMLGISRLPDEQICFRLIKRCRLSLLAKQVSIIEANRLPRAES